MGIITFFSYGKIFAMAAFEQISQFHCLLTMTSVIVIAQIDRLDRTEFTEFTKESLCSCMPVSVFNQTVLISGPEKFIKITFLETVLLLKK